jgi:hypothetical protein
MKGKRLTIALAIFALIVVPLAIYTTGYLLLPQRVEWADDGFGYAASRPPTSSVEVIERVYPQQWMTAAFGPAAKLEGHLRGIEVQATWRATSANGWKRLPSVP